MIRGDRSTSLYYFSNWNLQIMDFIFKAMFHINFAIDFILYSASCNQFRAATQAICSINSYSQGHEWWYIRQMIPSKKFHQGYGFLKVNFKLRKKMSVSSCYRLIVLAINKILIQIVNNIFLLVRSFLFFKVKLGFFQLYELKC